MMLQWVIKQHAITQQCSQRNTNAIQSNVRVYAIVLYVGNTHSFPQTSSYFINIKDSPFSPPAPFRKRLASVLTVAPHILNHIVNTAESFPNMDENKKTFSVIGVTVIPNMAQ